VRKRFALIGTTIVIALAIVAGGLAYVALGKTVTLLVDGQATTLRTFAGEVGDVLESEGVEIDFENDPIQLVVEGEAPKVEGLSVLERDDAGVRVLATVDADDPEAPSLAVNVHVRW